jgi:hypothetical protein
MGAPGHRGSRLDKEEEHLDVDDDAVARDM